MLGDTVGFKINLSDGYGRVITGADVYVFNRFFSQALFDDGKHADENRNDGIYAGEVTIPSIQTSGEHEVHRHITSVKLMFGTNAA